MEKTVKVSKKQALGSPLIALLVGLIFALGLGLGGMTQPERVLGFLNIFGAWDPSLLFVMIGAVTFHFVTYRLIRKRHSPLLSGDWHVPSKREITPALMIGAILFGMGWGLAGYCPGPAVVALGSFESKPLIFVVGLVLGMMAFKGIDKKLKIKR